MENIDKIVNMINDEYKDCQHMKEEVMKSYTKAPKGYLQVNMKHDAPQYYLCNFQKGIRTRKYISKHNQELAKQLAQKEYDKEMVQTLEEYIKWLQRTRDTAPQKGLLELWETEHPARRKLIQPYVISDEEYCKQWESVTYEGKSFYNDTPEIYTDKGERVRSKSEKIIADKLKSMGIPYRYEYPLYLKGYGTIYPDFTLLNTRTRKEYYLEHFGMMDLPEYACKAVQKLESYGRNGIFPGNNLLITYETSDMICDMRVVQKLLETFLL